MLWIIEKAREFQKKKNLLLLHGAKLFDCMDHNKLWKILKEMIIPDQFTCLLRNLYAGQEATVRTWHGTMDWFLIGKDVCQGCIFLPYLFNFCAEYIMQNARLDEAQAEVKIAWRSVNNLRWYHPYGRKRREVKVLLEEDERGEWKSWLKIQHSGN